MWKKLFGVTILAGLGALLVLKLIKNATDEHYSQRFASESISEARSRKVFISQPSLKRNVIHLEKSKYLIRDVWIEQATQTKYDWIFFRRVIPTNYRLLLRIDETGNLPRDFSRISVISHFSNEIICNDSISLTTIRSVPLSASVLRSSEFSTPLPDSIECVVKKQN